MIIKRVGGKTKIAPWIVSHLPRHSVFVDVFGGSGAVLDQMPLEDRRKRYVYNDLDRKLFTLFRVMRDQPLELADQISLTPYSREEFELAMRLIQDDKFDTLSDLDKAAVFLICNRQSFGSKMARPWSITLDGEVNYVTWNKLPAFIVRAARRFKYVYLENLDYHDLIRKWDSPNTAFYLDPPYEGVESDYYEVNRESGFDHAEMFRTLQSIQGSYAVSYYGGETPDQDTDLVKQYAEAGCRIYRKKVIKDLSNSDRKSTAVEVLIVKGRSAGRQMREIE
jgi:DNA adenine methylase